MVDSSGVSDDELHRRLLTHDDAALADLYARYSPVVFNVALRVTASRPAAEEVSQAVFLDVWHRPARFDPSRGPIRPWLAAMAHHRSVDWVRQEAARRGREHRSAEGRVDDVVGVEEAVVAVIKAERVRLALDELCESERTPICLAYFGNRTYRQVALELGVAEGTIKSRIRTGLQHLAGDLRSETLNPAF